jgi:hypothetical protein
MLLMTATSASQRILLLPEERTAAGPHAAKIRRYRLARMRLVERRDEQAARLAQRGFPLGCD